MSSPAFEAFLARLYADASALERFLADPAAEAARDGLSPPEIESLKAVDLEGLRLAADSFRSKRKGHKP